MASLIEVAKNTEKAPVVTQEQKPAAQLKNTTQLASANPNVSLVASKLKNSTLPVVKPTQMAVTPEKKNVAFALSEVLPRMTYYGPNEFMTKIGDGCSKQAADLTQSMYGGDVDLAARQDAWYAKAAVLKSGGKDVWNPSMKKDFSKVQIGSYVSLDRPGMVHDFDKSKDKSLTAKDNEKVEHRGVVVGFDKDGTPLIRHGSSEGTSVVQRYDKLKLPEYPWSYSVKSIYTPKSIIGKEIVDKRYYTKPAQSDSFSFNPNNGEMVKTPIGFGVRGKATENESKFIQAINANLPKQMQVLGLSKPESNLISQVAFGIFNNESKAGTSKNWGGVGSKMIVSSLAKAVGAKKSSPSYGDIQFKYDDLVSNADKSTSKVGRNLYEMNVKKEGLAGFATHRDDYNDEVNAVAAKTATTLSLIKSNPEKYQYNPKTQTIFGNIPLGVALAAAYSKGDAIISSKEKLMKADKDGNKAIVYGTNAMKHSNKLLITTSK